MQKPFILIIEDDRDIAALFRHFMDLGGYRTEIASSGELAIERLAHCQPDAVLLDLSLPGIPGTRVLQTIRSDVHLKHLPVIVVTAYSELADTLPVEPDLLLMKPVSSEQLIGLVERLRAKNNRPETGTFNGTPWDRIAGIYNRAFFMNRVDSAIQSLHSGGQILFAILSIGTSAYETVRLRYGEARADEFLEHMATVLKASVRPVDTIAHFDGERFHILIEQAPGLRIPEMIALRVTNRLQEKGPAAEGIPITYNIAVLLCDDRYKDAGEILCDAQRSYDLGKALAPTVCPTFDHDSIRGACASTPTTPSNQRRIGR